MTSSVRMLTTRYIYNPMQDTGDIFSKLNDSRKRRWYLQDAQINEYSSDYEGHYFISPTHTQQMSTWILVHYFYVSVKNRGSLELSGKSPCQRLKHIS